MTSFEERFNKRSEYINSHSYAKILLKVSNVYLTYFIALMYVGLLIYLIWGNSDFTDVTPLIYKGRFINVETSKTVLVFKLIFTPAVSLILISTIRSCINAKRPYEIYNIKPIINKNTKGNSMPSRHVFSITMISMCWIYVMPIIGVIMMILVIVMATGRVIAGIHFFRDVIVGFLCGLILGFIGLWLI